MLALEVIEDVRRLREFQPEWAQFVQKHPCATPFQTPEWLTTWWSHFGSGALRVMTFRRDGEVAGVLPCFLHEWQGQRQMTLIGAGISDYLDPLLEPSSVPEALELLRGELSSRTDWDLCDWQDLSHDTPLAALGTATHDTPCSVIPIDQSFDTYFAALPSVMRRNLRRDKRKSEAAGAISFDVANRATPELLDALVDLHSARWEMDGQAGMIAANRAEPFMRDIAERFGRAGSLRIFTLRFNGSIAAIILAFCDGRTIYSYLGGFDPEHQDYSFGRELLAQSLRYAHEHGYRRWDFLRGQEAYKFEWGAQALAKCRVMIRP
jgi:CelD/BcsL family acetyltransferase involved in cellulose biosynthesis